MWRAIIFFYLIVIYKKKKSVKDEYNMKYYEDGEEIEADEDSNSCEIKQCKGFQNCPVFC